MSFQGFLVFPWVPFIEHIISNSVNVFSFLSQIKKCNAARQSSKWNSFNLGNLPQKGFNFRHITC